MAGNGSILVTGAAGQLGAVGRTVTGLLLDRGLLVRAMVRREDDRAAALRAAGAEVVVLVRNLIAALVRAEEVP
jgi:NAD(P)H dehydrogenase (quinone)